MAGAGLLLACSIGKAFAAATAVYVLINGAGGINSSPPSGATIVAFSNISATPAAFHLVAGKYAIAVKASAYGTVTLKILGPDGTTYLTAATAFSADGIETVDLPDGTYEIVIA